METVMIANGMTYILVANGVAEFDEKLTITFLAAESEFPDIESEFDNAENTGKIVVRDTSGETMYVRNGYTVLESIEKRHGYVVGKEEYVSDTYVDEETGESREITGTRDVLADVYVVVVKKPDVQARVMELQNAVDTIVLGELGVL